MPLRSTPRSPPQVRTLERRIVLNATAELAAFGDLMISGDAAPDAIEVQTNALGRIEILDANNAVIPIRVGVDGFGNPILADSVAQSQITSGRLTVELGGGDDSLLVDLPADLNLTVIDGAGIDSIDATLTGDANGAVDQVLNVDAESIILDADGNSLDLTSSEIDSSNLGGSIRIQNAFETRLGDINVAGGALVFGESNSPIGEAISQAPGTAVNADTLSAWNDGDMLLDLDMNSINRLVTISSTGDVSIQSTSEMVVDSVIAENVSLVVSNNDGDLTIGSIAVIDPSTGDVQLAAGDDIMSANGNPAISIIADDLFIRSGNTTADGDTAVSLTTQVNDLDAVVLGTNRGDLIIDEADSIHLASSEITQDAATLMTGNGFIRVNAGGAIVIEDSDSSNDGASLTDDEVISRGTDGGIELTAATDFQVGDSVQLASMNSDAAAVSISASRVVIGRDFEINTGNGEGIARRFSPRPDPEGLQPTNPPIISDPAAPGFIDVETAFYDVNSVVTDTLTGVNLNDAVGTLSIDIGAEGENGLTLQIDWGAQSNRFQELTDLAGNRTQVNVQHVYLEQEILNSRLNGRASATDPLAVRFAVSHHESIQIQGQIIEQAIGANRAGSISEPIPGSGLISSTDDLSTPNTANPGYENGTAFFVIPRIDVPVAFYPVRDVIPEVVEPTPVVLPTTVTLVSDVQLDTVEASASSITIREEYFQLRTLSPDPNGEDLTEPVRLPERALSGDRLSDLFANLPDGSYEIQYVIGDGDERTILRVELRGGEPIILGDELDAGTLKLRRIEEEPSAIPENDESSDTAKSGPLDDQTKTLEPEMVKPEPTALAASPDDAVIRSPKPEASAYASQKLRFPPSQLELTHDEQDAAFVADSNTSDMIAMRPFSRASRFLNQHAQGGI